MDKILSADFSRGSKSAKVTNSQLEASAWLEFSKAQSFADIAGSWLRLQLLRCDAETGVVYRKTNASPSTPDLVAAIGENAAQDLHSVAHKAITAESQVIERPHSSQHQARLAQPLMDGAQVCGAVAVLLEGANPTRLEDAKRSLQWGLSGLREQLLLDRIAEQEFKQQAIIAAHELFAAALEDHEFRQAAIGAATRLAGLGRADRVSIGFRNHNRTVLSVVSNSAEFGKRMNLNRLVVAAMDEAIDQRASLSHPMPEGEVNATRAQAAVAKLTGSSNVLTIPFVVADSHRGAVTFERPEGNAFSSRDVAFLDFIVSLAGPLLWEKYQNGKLLIFKMFDASRDQFAAFLGPGHLRRKFAAVVLVGLTILALTWTKPYKVVSDAVIEGTLTRSMVAPYDGFIRTAPLRAGDRVRKGEVIAALDGQDLLLERLERVAEYRQKLAEYGQAIGSKERADANIVRSQMDQVRSRIRLIDSRLERARMTAPFDAIIISGDQSQNIGGSVNRGESLFEVAPLDNYRIILEVDESKISDIKPGQFGELVVTALPDTHFPIEVKQLMPIAAPKEGHNLFRVEAELLGDGSGLWPGMKGVGKVEVDERLALSIWTRDLVDWLRLTVWAWSR